MVARHGKLLRPRSIIIETSPSAVSTSNITHTQSDHRRSSAKPRTAMTKNNHLHLRSHPSTPQDLDRRKSLRSAPTPPPKNRKKGGSTKSRANVPGSSPAALVKVSSDDDESGSNASSTNESSQNMSAEDFAQGISADSHGLKRKMVDSKAKISDKEIKRSESDDIHTNGELDDLALQKLRLLLTEQFDLEILLKHRECHLILDEIAKVKASIEQLEQCQGSVSPVES